MVLLILNRHLAAIQDFARAQAIDPHFKYLPGLLLHTKMQCCHWHLFADESQQLMLDARAGQCVSGPFALLSVSGSAHDQLVCAQTWVRDNYPPSAPSIFKAGPYAHERIRLAYLSGDFHDHPLSRLMSGVFDRHDPTRFETIAVSFGPERDSVIRQSLKVGFRRFIDARHQSDQQIADQLRDLEVDIAVDLMGFTRDARTSILARRPVPVQVNYLGYPATMGASYIDYIVADQFVIPLAARRSCTIAQPIRSLTRIGSAVTSRPLTSRCGNVVVAASRRKASPSKPPTMSMPLDDRITPARFRSTAERRGTDHYVWWASSAWHSGRSRCA
jgi:protein O-GlcNAc transferase